MQHKYIFVVGGVLSGVGKGTTTASIGLLLKDRGFRVTALKIDPYLNIDAGTMNPVEHGEVFVTEDGAETDQDLGNYERFLDTTLHKVNYMTAGSVFDSVLRRERALGYEGKCVEFVPHVPDEALARIEKAADDAQADVVLIEIGGTVGEYQNIIFLEAARILKLRQPEDVAFVLVSYLPVPPSIGEMKTKPTQYAVRALNSTGIQPDFIVARSEFPIDDPRKEKMSVHCNIRPDHIIAAPNVDSIYEVPLNFQADGFVDKLLNTLKLPLKTAILSQWRDLVSRIKTPEREVRIAVVGKYFSSGGYILADAYISVIEALKHAAWFHKAKPILTWLHAEHFEEETTNLNELLQYDGVLIPGGFGSRGIEGKLAVVKFCREQAIPLFGICYGLQLMVIEAARTLCHMHDANTTEIDPKTAHPVVDLLPEQQQLLVQQTYGGSMRLGAFSCDVTPGSRAHALYQKGSISERHRHRYEVNNAYLAKLADQGMIVSGMHTPLGLVEIMERPDHPFFVGVQFHPEFQSRPLIPHPLFRGFIETSLKSRFAH